MSASTSGSGLELLCYASCKLKLPSASKAKMFSLESDASEAKVKILTEPLLDLVYPSA
jgi:hypothetical protein